MKRTAAVGITLCKGPGARECDGRSYGFIARRFDGQGNVGGGERLSSELTRGALFLGDRSLTSVNQAEISLSAPESLVAWQLLASFARDADISSLLTPFLNAIESHISRNFSVKSVVFAHVYVLTWVELRSTLSKNNVSRCRPLVREKFQTKPLAWGGTIVRRGPTASFCCMPHLVDAYGYGNPGRR